MKAVILYVSITLVAWLFSGSGALLSITIDHVRFKMRITKRYV